MTNIENITAPSSGLSKLQKRVLVYARTRMIEQGQTIECRGDLGTKICLVAPDWLTNALFSLSEKVTHGRRHHVRDGEFVDLDHPVINLISEAVYITEYLKKAAADAGCAYKFEITKLYKLAIDGDLVSMLEILGVVHKLTYLPWPNLMSGRLVFTVWLGNPDADAVRQSLGEKVATPTAWIDDSTTIPINCTVSEMLRDLYGFPVRSGGYIEALAFDQEVIGRDVYNKANATLRRACDRLRQRGLVGVREAQKPTMWGGTTYVRSGIGLTERGVTVADGLLPETDQAVSSGLLELAGANCAFT